MFKSTRIDSMPRQTTSIFSDQKTKKQPNCPTLMPPNAASFVEACRLGNQTPSKV